VLLLLLGVAGCGDRNREPLPAETDEPFYVQGKQLLKQGRKSEALTAFLKVIDRRGERGAAESHLEAGYIYLEHTKDPVEAYHHFRKYLVLQPNSREAASVRGMVEAAKREFARTLPTRPLEDQSARLEIRETLDRLQRENEELRAQIATLRGGGPAPASRSAPMISLPADPGIRVSASAVPGLAEPAPAVPPPAAAAKAPPTPPARTALPERPAASPGARAHTVQPKETIFGISMRYYGHGRGTTAIYQANRDSMRHETDLRPGMVLRIPPLDGAAGGRR
jgi:tetratricopeptide (TPR) repeat protein